MDEVQTAIETECANCGLTGQCYDDGEAYVCVNFDMCVKNCRIRDLEADLTAALNIAEASARQCAKLREVCERVADFLETEKELEISDYLAACGRDIVQHLRAALAPEEPR